jgi:hypothetical protein
MSTPSNTMRPAVIRPPGQQAENRSGRRRFSGAGFTDNGNGLTAAHGQLDVMHGGSVVAEPDFQARDT